MDNNIENLLFNLSCVGSPERIESGDYIYYINSDGMNNESDEAVWRVKKDGSENQRLQKSDVKVLYLIDVDEHWVYYGGLAKSDPVCGASGDILRIFTKSNSSFFKVTIRGTMERQMSGEDIDRYLDEIHELEERNHG